MRTLIKLIPLVLFGVATGVQACGSIKQDDLDYANGGRRLPVVGVIQGTVLYQGPKPCSANGHIVGAAIMLVFDAKNPPPPDGLATTAVNFVAVPGDTLFADQPRVTGSTPYCPKDNGDTAIVTASAPYTIAPMAAGQYVMQAFYDYTGDFLPTFSFRRLPVAGDIGGGHIDTNDPNVLIPGPDGALIPKASLANYLPVFQRINIGVPGSVPVDSIRQVPTFTMPDTGFVADNVSVAIGVTLPLPRPYFWPDGADARGPDGDANRDTLPIKTVPSDLQVYAQPTGKDQFNEGQVNKFQNKFPSVLLHAGLPSAELASGLDPSGPFKLQLSPTASDNGLFVWWNGNHTDLGGSNVEDVIPEGTVPRLWPLAVFAKLKDDPNGVDPEGLLAQGSDGKQPIVIIQGITLAALPGSIGPDSLYSNVLSTLTTPIPKQPSASTKQDHVLVLIRPSALCLDPRHPDRGGILVTPHEFGSYPPGGQVDNDTNHKLVDKNALVSNPQLKNLLKSTDPSVSFAVACLPKGRYGVNLVYPTGQAWTTPNELGSCAAKEGANNFESDPGSCSDQPRPVLYSQGNRAVIEVGDPDDQAWCDAHPVPADCTTLAPE